MIVGLAAAPFGVLLWLVLRGRARAPVGGVGALAPGLGRRLFVDPACRLQDLTLTAVIVLGDDVLVGYTGGHGSWFTGDPDDRGSPRVMEGLHDVAGQLLLPDLVRDTDAMVLLQRWRDQGARLTSVVPRDAGVMVLADRRRRTTVMAAFRGWAGSGELP